jgi:hypothetical protein
MNLKARIDRLEAARNTGAIEILRMRQDGGGSLTEIRGGRIARRQEVTAEEAARLARGAITIERGYGLPTSEARDDLPPTEKI